ncbi:MAG: carboxyltransferase domain-containing protein [Proteobacteria bacterium]|nr:carboxyltransferase domain-containing protein [Pseudomonadota bacterium]
MSVNSDVTVLKEARVSFCGSAAVLLDAEGPLALATQERIWRLSDKVRQWEGVVDTQPGMNSLLVVVDSRTADLEALAARLRETWPGVPSGRTAGRLIEVGVIYGGEGGQDLPEVAAFHKCAPADIAKLHSGPEYTIFAPGVSPGFGYLFGMDKRLFTPRRKVPVMRALGGGVSIAGIQSNLGKPYVEGTAKEVPTGWYMIGRAPDVPQPFDLDRTPPNLVSLGDRIRFRVDRVEA